MLRRWSDWFMRQSRSSRLGWSLIVIFAGVLLAGNGFGFMMGDPLTPEAHEAQKRWAPLAFFLGCPTGLALVGLGVVMLIGSSRTSA